MCVRENTSQAASVEFRRFAPKLCAQQTWGHLSENSQRIFDSLNPPSVKAEGDYLRLFTNCSCLPG